ncbi:MAG: substrate-binding domain-containing protein [Pseudomonadota bacterium]
MRKIVSIVFSLMIVGSSVSQAIDLPSSDSVYDQPTRIVGAPTMEGFGHVVTDRLLSRREAHIITDAAGTAAGFTTFCQSQDPKIAPVILAARQMTAIEREDCALMRQGKIAQTEIGLTGIVIAEGLHRKRLALTTTHLFYALASRVPSDAKNCTLVPNTSKFWSDIDPSLPRREIAVFGPPDTSGTRKDFLELAMVEGAMNDPCMKALKAKTPLLFQTASQDIRNDDTWIDAGDNSHSIVAAIMTMPHAIGVLEYPNFFPHTDRVAAIPINGLEPNRKSISSGGYALTQVLRIYSNTDALKKNPDADRFIQEITSERAIGERGYLVGYGLVPIQK